MLDVVRPTNGQDATWRKIESFLGKRTLIPILGRGAITFGDSDLPLYPWLINEVAERLRIDPAPATLHQLVCQHLHENTGTIEDVCLEVDEVLSKNAPPPGTLLRKLASLPQCRAFFTLGCDSLLEGALREVRAYSHEPWVFSTDRATIDLPPIESSATTLGYLFGKASANPGFHLWDADAVEFVWQLQRQLPALTTLGRTLAENNLLIIGAQMSDWAVRFLLRAVRQKPLTENAGKSFFLADGSPPQGDDTVIFYDSLKKGISVLQVDPIDFAHQFCDLALSLEPGLTAGTMPGSGAHIPLMEPVTPDGSVFISYSHTDHLAAFRVVEKLRAHGCIVWLDTERLTCGDNFENHLESAVMKTCGFFVSIISHTTESRSEAYFHKERNWAANRSISMPMHARPFYFPVVIDNSSLPPQHEPTLFAKIDCERSLSGEISDEFATRLAEYQRRLQTPV